MDKTILDYEEATSIAPDDYIVMDSPSGGTSKVLASAFGDYDPELELLYNWDFTKSLVDSIQGKQAVLSNNATRTSEGIVLAAKNQRFSLPDINLIGKRIEIDVAKFDFKGDINNNHIRFICVGGPGLSYLGLGPLIYKYTTPSGWSMYGFRTNYTSSSDSYWTVQPWNTNLSGTSSEVLNAFNGKTVKMDFPNKRKSVLYLDNELQGVNEYMYPNNDCSTVYIGGMDNSSYSYNQFYNATISSIRIYSIPEEPMLYEDGLIYNYDFSKSLTDEIWQNTIDNHASYTDGKILLNSQNAYCQLPNLLSDYHYIVEVDVGEITPHTGTTHGRFLMFNTESGLIYRNNASWECYLGGWKTNTATTSLDLTDAKLFENSTITVDLTKNSLKLYKDGELFCENQHSLESTHFYLGASSYSFYGAAIKAVRCYER